MFFHGAYHLNDWLEHGIYIIKAQIHDLKIDIFEMFIIWLYLFIVTMQLHELCKNQP